MASEFGTATYWSADDPSKEVVVTVVAENEQHGCGWDDMVYLGKVKGHIRSDNKASRNLGAWNT
tara:strand:- start:7027 stop:7218 length:192 start_codon:yes stop_codon:yes gene_type:complete